MKIILANPRGFCAGVNMAIESLERRCALYGSPLYVYHEIVHNRPIVERFQKLGVVFVDDIAEVPTGGTVLYSAHGVSPVIRQHSDRAQPAGDRRDLPAGHEGPHGGDQVRPRGLHHRPHRPRGARRGHRHDGRGPREHGAGRGRGGRGGARLPADAKLAFLTQTTLSVDEAKVVIDALKRKFPQIVGPNKDDICYATQNRQEAVQQAGRRGRRGAGARQPEQLEQPAAGGARPRERQAGVPHRPRRANCRTSGSARPTRC